MSALDQIAAWFGDEEHHADEVELIEVGIGLDLDDWRAAAQPPGDGGDGADGNALRREAVRCHRRSRRCRRSSTLVDTRCRR